MLCAPFSQVMLFSTDHCAATLDDRAVVGRRAGEARRANPREHEVPADAAGALAAEARAVELRLVNTLAEVGAEAGRVRPADAELVDDALAERRPQCALPHVASRRLAGEVGEPREPRVGVVQEVRRRVEVVVPGGERQPVRAREVVVDAQRREEPLLRGRGDVVVLIDVPVVPRNAPGRRGRRPDVGQQFRDGRVRRGYLAVGCRQRQQVDRLGGPVRGDV